jgi:hypothetical protein
MQQVKRLPMDTTLPTVDHLSPSDVGIVVVHGVGDAVPGTAIDTLLEALKVAQPGTVLRDSCELCRLPEDPDVAGGTSPRFPVHIRREVLPNGTKLAVAEVYWADISHQKPGRLQAGLAIFRAIFEVHHIVDGLLDRRSGILERSLRFLLLTVAGLLRGPIAGFNVCLIAMGLAYFQSTKFSTLTPYLPNESIALIAAMIGCVILGLMLRRWFRIRQSVWSDVGVSIILCAMLILLVFVIVTWNKDPLLPFMKPFIARNLYIDRPLSSFENMFVLFSFLLGWTWLALSFIVAATFLLFCIMLLRASLSAHWEQARSAAVAFTVVLVQAVVWALVVRGALLALRVDYFHDPKIDVVVNYVIWSFFLNALVFTIVALVIMFLLVVRRVLVCVNSPPPRLIFSPVILTTVIGITVAGHLFAIWWLLYSRQWQAIAAQIQWLDPQHLVSFAGFIISGVLLLASLLETQLSAVLHIVRDLIDHQFRLGLTRSHVPGTRSARAIRLRRERIARRFNSVVDRVLREHKSPPLVLVGHSQGSVVIFDHLKRALDGPPKKALTCHVITFGSPLSHLYEHYFGEYEGLSTDLKKLGEIVASWTNLYRIDDPIGTTIGGSHNGLVHNICMARPGGHTNYWAEPEVARAVLEVVSVASCVQESRETVA